MVSLSSARAAIALYRRRQRAARQVTLELGLMTDSELNDLDISRSAISRLAQEAAAQVSAH